MTIMLSAERKLKVKTVRSRNDCQIDTHSYSIETKTTYETEFIEGEILFPLIQSDNQ